MILNMEDKLQLVFHKEGFDQPQPPKSIDRKLKYGFMFPKIKSVWCRLTQWGRVMHICISKLTIIGSDNGLSHGRGQVIIWTNAGLLSIGPLGTNFSEMLIEIYKLSFEKVHLKMSSGKWQQFCLGLCVLRVCLTHLIEECHCLLFSISSTG